MKKIHQNIVAAGAVLSLNFLFACTPAATQQALGPSEALGKVLAEETAHTMTGKQVVLITPKWKPGATSTVEDYFKRTMKGDGITVVTISVNVGDPMNLAGVGLKADDFLAAMGRADGGAVVSLAGGPLLGPRDLNRIGASHPPVIVVATASLGDTLGVPGDRAKLNKMLQAKVIQLAIVDGAQSGAATAANADAAHQTFSENYSILRSAN